MSTMSTESIPESTMATILSAHPVIKFITTILDHLLIANRELLTLVGELIVGLGYAIIWVIGILLPPFLGGAAGLLIGWLLGRFTVAEIFRRKKDDKGDGPLAAVLLGFFGTLAFHVFFQAHLEDVLGDSGLEPRPEETYSSTVLLASSVLGTIMVLGGLIVVVGVWALVVKLVSGVWKKDYALVKEKVEVEGGMVKREPELV